MFQEAGLYVQVQGEEGQEVPLREIFVRAFVQGSVVGFRSKLTYENNTNDPLEILFRTPVNDSSAVVGLEAVIDGRKIRAELQEKAKAKEMYEKALSSGRTAAFGEEKKGDIFSVALGNLPPGKQAEIFLTIVGELDVDPDGAVRFLLPTVLKPRYTPAGGTDPLAPASAPAKHGVGPHTYKFELTISGAPEVAQVTSPSHEISQENNGEIIKIGVVEGNRKDIVILVHPREPHKPQVIVEPGFPDGENDFQKSAAVMLTFFPEFKGDSSCIQAASEFVFLVDRSGSMDGTYINDAAKTLLLFIKSIPEGCYFNVVSFGSSYEKLFPESVPYNQKNMEVAVRHAEQLQAELGGTQLLKPLKEIFGHSQIKGLPRQVFVLTDGSVSNTWAVINLVENNSHKARCFSFGFGSGASTTLVKGIATAGRGTAEFITHGERMQPKVIRSLKKAMQPAVTDVKVNFDLPNEVSVQVAPKRLPPIFVGERTIVYAIIKETSSGKGMIKGTVCLSGDLLGSRVEHKLKLEIPRSVAVARSDDQVTTIHHLAAKLLIKEMETGYDRLYRKQAIIQLSLDSSVISGYTGFIAIDDNKEKVKGSLQTWDVFSPLGESYQCRSMASLPPCGSRFIPMPRSFWSFAGLKSKIRARKAKKMETCKFSPLPARHAADSHHSENYKEPPASTMSCSSPGGLSSSTEEYSRKSHNIIDLQLASGAWNLTKEFAALLGKTEDFLKANCPVPCEGAMEVTWATIIALCYLEMKQADLKDEWELVATKAQAWLTKQSLPEGWSIEALRHSAANVFLTQTQSSPAKTSNNSCIIN